MAEQLALVRTFDFQSDQGTVSLLSNTDGFEPAYRGWTPASLPNRQNLVDEAITLRVNGTSTDDISASLQKLTDKAIEAQRYFASGARDYAVFFRVQAYGETKARQSLVYNIEHEAASSIFEVALRQRYHWNEYTVGIERAPWWEGTAAGTITQGSISALGGTFAYGTVNGNLSARIARVEIGHGGTAVLDIIWPSGKAWIGFKSNRYGNVATFKPYWSFGTIAEDAIGAIGGLGTIVADATAKGGSASRWMGAGSVIPPRLIIGASLGGALGTANLNAMDGDYLVLLRARVAGSAEYLVQLREGWADDWMYEDSLDPDSKIWPAGKSYPRVAISNDLAGSGTAYKFYEMGRVSIPPYKGKRNSSELSLFEHSFLIFGEWLGGTSIYLDGLFFVPLDAFCYVGADFTNAYFGGTTTKIIATQGPNGLRESNAMGSANYTGGGTSFTVTVASGVPTFLNGLDPGYSGIGVVVAESVAQSLLTHSVTIEARYFERWKEWRGND